METKEDKKKSRHRGDNWTQDEKDIFIQIMSESSHIIENKHTDTNTNKKKNLEWIKVQSKLKELTGNNRDVPQLKGLWRRLKITAKKNLAQHKKSFKMTGGGHKPPSPSQDDIKILELCPTDFIIENNDFDSDGTYHTIQTNKQPTKILENTKDTTIYDLDINENVTAEAEVSFVDEVITVADVHNNEVHIEEATKMNSSKEKFMPTKDEKKEKHHKLESNRASILKSNEDLKKLTAKLLEEEHKLKIEYHKRELCHQQLRHNLELDILLLEKEKKELEIKRIKKSLE